jgi:hypothetical protein
MTPIEFLRFVLPESGTYCLAAILGKKVEHLFLPAIADFELASSAIDAPVNQYFACASFNDGAERKQSNVAKIKSFWLDVDSNKDDGSGYPTQAEAASAVMAFIKATGLPHPVVVSSGNGLHLYWPLEKEIAPEVWLPIAKRLKALCVEHGLRADPSCTSDSARILRIPGTFNYRDPKNPKPVELLKSRKTPIKLLAFAEKLGAGEADVPDNVLPFAVPKNIKYAMDDVTQAFMKNNVTRFKNILVRTETCAQLQHICNNQAQISEPLWRAGLSIAQVCVDRDEAIHAMSNQHPDYSHAATEDKANKTEGPQYCKTFEGLNPDGCKGCAQRGNITTPVVLGREIQRATDEDNVVKVVDPLTRETVQEVIEPFPYPFFRGKNGGVYVETGEGESRAEACIYEHDFYVVKRMQDPVLGESILLRLKLPHDGVREFSLPLPVVVAKDKFRDAIAEYGIMASGESFNSLMAYIQKTTKRLQMRERTENMRTQMGWTPEGTFLIGDREVIPTAMATTATEVSRYSPPSAATLRVNSMLQKKGTIEEWLKVVNFYDTPGLEPFAFAAFLSFGAPLMHFTQYRGGIYNLMSNQSGVGKSTALMVANSIWGHPVDLLLQKDDTYNARIHRMGVLQHLPITIDEITNLSPIEMSNMVYAATAARGKNRLQASTNAERVNNTTWQAPTLASSNSSLIDKLSAEKDFPEGELMRVMEVPVQRIMQFTKAHTDALFAKLHTNYGIAGELFMGYVVNNLDESKRILTDIQTQTDRNARLNQRERIWSNMASIALAGGTIAATLGLHNINVERVSRWASTFLANAVESTKGSVDGSDSLAAYINQNINNVLIIDDSDTTYKPIATREPRGELLIRYEPNTQTIYLSSPPFKAWCAKRQVGYNELINNLLASGLDVKLAKKRMAKGTLLSTPPANVLAIHDPYSRVFDMEAVLDETKPKA